ncbi:unnamed protein product, partial [Iphiclides podalirius]
MILCCDYKNGSGLDKEVKSNPFFIALLTECRRRGATPIHKRIPAADNPGLLMRPASNPGPLQSRSGARQHPVAG